MRFFRRSAFRLLLTLAVALPIVGNGLTGVHAASSRVAVLKELSGSVQVKKSGGSKSFRAFARMSLNEGDLLMTGPNSTAVLQFANGTSEDDKMTVASNSTLTFSKLSDRKGTRTKVSMLNGTTWVDVKSIASKNDEFTLETPTAIMGVRGTHLLVSVEPVSGATRLTVAAGVVGTTLHGDPRWVNVYPAEKALIVRSDRQTGDIAIAPVDLDALIQQNEKPIIEAILKAAGDITLENRSKMDIYFRDTSAVTPDDINRKKSNIENLLGAIADQAVSSSVLSRERVDEIIREAEKNSGIQIDLNKKEWRLNDRDKQQQNDQRKKEEEAINRAAQETAASEDLQKKLEEEKRRLEELNRKTLEEKKRQSESDYLDQLTDSEKNRFQEDKKRLEGGLPDASSPQPSSPVSGSGSGSGAAPPASKSNDALLSGLGLSAGTIAFSPAATDYQVNVLKSVDSLTVTPAAADGAKAKIRVNGIAVSSGSEHSVALGAPGTDTPISILVTAEDGTTHKEYTVNVHRDDLISNVTLPDNLGITFDPSRLSYAVPPVLNGANSISMAFGSAEGGNADHFNVIVSVNGTPVGTYAAGALFTVPLADDYNEVVVSLVEQNSLANRSLFASRTPMVAVGGPEPAEKEYRFKIWRAAENASGDLLGVRVNRNTAAQSENGEFSATLPADADRAEIEFYTMDAADVVEWNGVTKPYGETFAYDFSAGQIRAESQVSVRDAEGALKSTYRLTLTKETLTVDFDSQGGSAVMSQEVAYGETAQRPSDPTKTGCTFAGWYGDADLTEPFDFETPITADTTLYAKWDAVARPTYTVNYDGNGNTGGSVPASVTEEEQTDVTVSGNSGNLTKTGHVFAGWNTESGGGGTGYQSGDSLTLTSNVTLYAQWTRLPYVLSYDGNGNDNDAAAPAGGSYLYGDAADVADQGQLARTGYTFAGWNTAPDGSGDSYAAGEKIVIAKETVLYAQWTKQPFTLTYEANGEDVQGTLPSGGTYDYGTVVTTAGRGDLSRTEYDFTEWNTLPDGNGVGYNENAPLTVTGDVYLYAQWQIHQYEVIYAGNGNTAGTPPVSSIHDYGSKIVVQGSESLAKTNSTFVGWNTQADGEGVVYLPGQSLDVLGTVYLYAQWEDVPEPSDIVLSSNNVYDDAPAGTAVGTFSTINADGETMVYELVDGAGSDDNGKFRIVGNRLVTSASFDASHTVNQIRVRASDGASTLEKQLVVYATSTISRWDLYSQWGRFKFLEAQASYVSGNQYTATVFKLADIFGLKIRPTATYGMESITVSGENGVLAKLTGSPKEIFISGIYLKTGQNALTITIVDTHQVTHVYSLDVYIQTKIF